MAAHSSTLPGESHGQRSPVDYSPRGRKESDTTERLNPAHRSIKELTRERDSGFRSGT